jgi:hypothetical protein
MDSVMGERGFISLGLEKLVDCIPILSRWRDDLPKDTKLKSFVECSVRWFFEDDLGQARRNEQEKGEMSHENKVNMDDVSDTWTIDGSWLGRSG